MENQSPQTKAVTNQLVAIALRLPWLEIITDLWKDGKKALSGWTDEGMYEVLEYESVLELKDKHGKRAHFRKREKVRYLQNGIIAYQDQAWGDGEILQRYLCVPGTPVDRYRLGHKTHVLVSLRDVKTRGDVDEFKIEWGIRKGFIRSTEQWETEISHRTKHIKTQVVFPEARPPLGAAIIESLRRRTRSLGQGAISQRPDGRWQISWETSNPRLHERYILQWKW